MDWEQREIQRKPDGNLEVAVGSEGDPADRWFGQSLWGRLSVVHQRPSVAKIFSECRTGVE